MSEFKTINLIEALKAYGHSTLERHEMGVLPTSAKLSALKAVVFGPELAARDIDGSESRRKTLSEEEYLAFLAHKDALKVSPVYQYDDPTHEFYGQPDERPTVMFSVYVSVEIEGKLDRERLCIELYLAD